MGGTRLGVVGVVPWRRRRRWRWRWRWQSGGETAHRKVGWCNGRRWPAPIEREGLDCWAVWGGVCGVLVVGGWVVVAVVVVVGVTARCSSLGGARTVVE